MSDAGEERAERDRGRVAEALGRVKAGVRQRQAVLAASDGERRGLPAVLVRLGETRHLQEPVISSHRPLVGPLIVLFKKVGYHLFAKLQVRALVRQQNAFNQAVSLAIQDLYERREAPPPAEPAEPAAAGPE